jgi:hypothetical protein
MPSLPLAASAAARSPPLSGVPAEMGLQTSLPLAAVLYFLLSGCFHPPPAVRRVIFGPRFSRARLGIKHHRNEQLTGC